MADVKRLLQLIIDNKDVKRDFRAEKTESGNVIWLYDVIDPWYGVSAAQVGRALEGFGGADVELRLNSPGGDVFEGRAIQTRLKQYAGNVNVIVDGIAASAATTVALGGDKRTMADGAFFMIHNSWTLAYGNRNEFRKVADLLEKIDGEIGKDYAVATGKSREEIQKWMDDETWFTAVEAKEQGFIHDIFTGDNAVAAKNRNTWNLSAYANVPKGLIEKPEPDINPRAHLGRYLDMIERRI